MVRRYQQVKTRNEFGLKYKLTPPTL